jgi:hypothetical protein
MQCHRRSAEQLASAGTKPQTQSGSRTLSAATKTKSGLRKPWQTGGTGWSRLAVLLLLPQVQRQQLVGRMQQQQVLRQQQQQVRQLVLLQQMQWMLMEMQQQPSSSSSISTS